MGYKYTTIDGQRVEVNNAARFAVFADAFFKATGCKLHVRSGTRTHAEQEAIFYSRFRAQKSGNGPYNDVRYYKGVRYVRVSAAGTVAPPGDSNHEEDGPIGPRALDIYDSGASAGVTTKGTVRANWIRNNAAKYGYNPAGYNFGEPWHIEYTGALNSAGGPVSSGGSSSNSNAGLKVVQVQLNYLGYNVGLEDGLDGDNTERGVKAFQAAYGLDQDGVPGPKTKAKLIEVIKDIQNRLTAKGFNTQGADGIPGVNTKNATKAFQSAKKLVADSIMGTKSLATLKKADAPKPTTPKPSTPVTIKVDPIVKQYQRDLHFIGYVITVDGVKGTGTKDVLSTFQKDQKIKIDGDYGTNTEGKLRAEVKKVQAQLLAKGYDPKGVDGITGDDSEKALERFQKDNKLSVDHCAGPGTRAKLFAVVVPSKPSTPVTPKPPVVVEPGIAVPTGYKKVVDIAWPQTGAFDWAAIAKDNLGVIIKAAGAEDPAPKQVYGPALLYTQHLAGARGVGLPVGHYFFNNGAVSIREQADKFIEVLSNNIKLGDIIALDVEPDGADCPQFTPEQALEFCGYIEEVFNTKVFIYINRNTLANNNWSKVVKAGHPLWLATLDGSPYSGAVKYWSEFTINQYSAHGGTPGYAGDIDKNIIKADAFDKYGFKGVINKPTPDVDKSLSSFILSLEELIAEYR